MKSFQQGEVTQTLRIGNLSRLANVNVQTLRFYERQGLLPKPQRRLSGYREYHLDAVGLVILIKRIQALGFSLKEIKAIIDLGRTQYATMGDAVTVMESKIGEIDTKIDALRNLRTILENLANSHRQATRSPFAAAFRRHIQELSAQAFAEHERKAPKTQAGDRRKKK